MGDGGWETERGGWFSVNIILHSEWHLLINDPYQKSKEHKKGTRTCIRYDGRVCRRMAARSIGMGSRAVGSESKVDGGEKIW